LLEEEPNTNLFIYIMLSLRIASRLPRQRSKLVSRAFSSQTDCAVEKLRSALEEYRLSK